MARLEQPSNAASLILFIDAGNVIVFKFLQYLNASPEIFSAPSGITISLSDSEL